MGAQELESQQAILLATLRDAAGAPVSYQQLRRAGIEFPASVASELELAGVDIEHCHVTAEPREGRRGPREPGLRMQPAPAEEAATIVLAPAPAARFAELASVEPLRDRASRFGGLRRRIGGNGVYPRSGLLVGIGSLVVLVAVLVVGLSSGGAGPARRARSTVASGSQPEGRRSRNGPRGRTHYEANRSSSASASAPSASHADASSGLEDGTATKTSTHTESVAAPANGQTTVHPTSEANKPRSTPSTARSGGTEASVGARADASTPVSPQLAAQLESEGHGLLEGGSARAAIPVLAKAVAATGEHEGECTQPASEACLTYAYALYDLGRALLESGDASAAVPVLQRRLQIDNQRPAVEEELATAKAQIG